MAMIMQDKENLFDTDLFKPLHDALLSQVTQNDDKYEKIIIDHIKSSTFMISDGVVQQMKERILRRLIRTIRA